MNRLTVEVRGHAGHVMTGVPTVHKPKPGRDGCRERDAVVDEGEWSGARNVLPLRSSCSTFIN
jgi:hypothetical protein